MDEKKEKAKKNVNYYVEHFEDYISPKIVDEMMSNYVLWGVNNSFYDYLRDLFLNSTTNNSAIKGITRLAYGSGLRFNSTEQAVRLFSVMSAKSIKRSLLQLYAYNKFVVQIEYVKAEEGKGKRLDKAYFIPAKNVACGKKNEEGEITHFWYCENWESKRGRFKPKEVPAFGLGEDTDMIEIYFFQEELDGDEYYSPVSYHGCLQYAECEAEQSNFHLNHIINGFATNSIINFNNGVPDPDARRQLVNDFRKTKTGTRNAGKPFITFNDGVENAVTIASHDTPDPHKQYDFLDKLSEGKILLSHTVSSPLLLGIRDSSGGLGSNANEIREAYQVFRAMTLDPLRELFMEAMAPILLLAGVTETPKLKDLDIFEMDEEPTAEIEAETGEREFVKMAASKKKDSPDLSKDDESFWLTKLESAGEKVGDDWGVISETAVEDSDQEDVIANMMFSNTSPDDGKPQNESNDGDSGLFKIRYKYGPAQLKNNSRDLCKFLVGRAKSGVVYRKEEIEGWQDEGINSQFSPRGESTYSLWKYKGGCYCHHRWFRVVYFRRRNADGSFVKRSTTKDMENDDQTTVTEAKRRGVPDAKVTPKDWKTAATKPNDMPNRGKLN